MQKVSKNLHKRRTEPERPIAAKMARFGGGPTSVGSGELVCSVFVALLAVLLIGGIIIKYFPGGAPQAWLASLASE